MSHISLSCREGKEEEGGGGCSEGEGVEGGGGWLKEKVKGYIKVSP